MFPHNPRAAYRWADHGGSQQALQASNEGSHLRGRRVPPSLPKCPRLATLATDSSTVKGNPETSESVQILRFRPITHLIGHRAQFCLMGLQSLSTVQQAPGNHPRPQFPTQGPQMDLGRVYKPQCLISFWRSAPKLLSDLTQKRLSSLS